MHFSTLIVFQIALVIGFHSVQAEDKKMKMMRKIMCDPDFEDMKTVIVDCVQTEDFSEYEDLLKPCCEGMESMDPKAMTDFWCSKSDEEVKEIQECIESNIKESGKEEEIKAKEEPIEQCLMEKFSKKK